MLSGETKLTRRQMLRFLAFTGIGISNLGAMSTFFSACARRPFKGYKLRANKHGVTILVDGLRADVFGEMLDAGELPNIKQHLADRGITAETCVSTFPSTTGPAHLPFLNGVMPGHNNCPGLRWVDRSKRQLRDYCTMENVLFNNDFPDSNHTIYEVISGERTISIFDFVSRGASDVMRVPVKSLWFVLSGDMKVWERMDGYAVDAFKKAYLGGDPPRFTLIWLPSVDHLAHFHGSRDVVITDRIKDVDRQVGRLMQVLQKAGLYDNTLVSLVADHGLRDIGGHTNIRSVLGKYGLKVLEDLSSNDQFNSLYQNNAARGVSGNGFALLYFATKKEGRLFTMNYAWDRPIGYDELRAFEIEGEGRVDLIEQLRTEKGIRLVMVKRGDDDVAVFSRDGDGRIERDLASFRYTVRGKDPLEYADDPECSGLLDGQYHDKDIWFHATRNCNYPDGLFQILQLFDAERCGDIVVTSEAESDLMNQSHIASHGSMERAEIAVPFVIAGEGVKQGTIPIARTIDVYPTYLSYFGIPGYESEGLDVFI